MERVLRAALVLVLALPVLSAALEGQHRPATPTEQYKALLKQHQDAIDVFSKAYSAAKTDEERNKVRAEKSPPLDKLVPRFLELAEKYPNDPVAADALVWVVNNTSDSAGGKDSPRANALAHLLRDHVRSDKLAQVCQRMALDFRKESEAFLRTVLEKNPHKEVQGLACLALAQFLNSRLQRLDLLKDRPETVKLYENLFGKDYLQELQRQDRAKASKEVEALFERAAAKYGSVKSFGPTVGQQASAELFEIRHLAVGKEAPDIEGKDQDGKRFKLSDYRGKVVLLDFWSEF
jgi:thiol-disulfide isomerase/thioredoxin